MTSYKQEIVTSCRQDIITIDKRFRLTFIRKVGTRQDKYDNFNAHPKVQILSNRPTALTYLEKKEKKMMIDQQEVNSRH